MLLIPIHLLLSSKKIYTAHEIVPKSYRWYHRLFLYVLYNMVDGVIVHTNHSKKMLLHLFPISAAKCHIVPMGNYIFLDEIPAPTELEPDVSGQKRVLFFGIIEKRKGLMYLIQAFSQVKAAVPEAKLIIAGQPFEEVDKYLLAIKELGLEEQSVTADFEYIPLHRHAEYFGSAEVVVLPYTEITQSAVLQVAYAFSKPVVATRCGGLTEAVEDGRSGLLVPPGDSSALAEAIIKLLRDDALRHQMGQFGRHLAETKHSWAQIAQRIDDIYEPSDQPS
jgi:glycosyltransferase involved in cell wall biosynthesis